MSGMINRVARALHEAHKPWCDYTYPFEDARANPEIYTALAEAAIQAMRLPTLEMRDAWPSEPHMDLGIWRRIIDAALGRGDGDKA